MSIIHDAVQKWQKEQERARRQSRQSEETSTSGRWEKVLELQIKNAELETFFDDSPEEITEKNS